MPCYLKANNIVYRVLFFILFLIFFAIAQIKFVSFFFQRNIGAAHPASIKTTLLTLKNGENYIHGLITINDYLFALTNTKPTRLVKIKLSNFESLKTLIFPNDGKHDFGEDIIYVNIKMRIYIVFRGENGIYISEVNPDTLTYTDIGNPKKGVSGITPAISSDGNYLYVLTTTKPSRIYKISLSDYNLVASVILKGLNFGHALQFDGTDIYATGVNSPSWIAKIDPIALKFTSQFFFQGDNYATDDFAVTKDYAFVGLEAENGIVLRIQKNSLTNIDRINTGINAKCYGVFFYDGFIWALFYTSPGKLVKIDPVTLKMEKYLLGNKENYPSEMAPAKQDLFIAFWTSPAIIAKIDTNYQTTSLKSFWQ